MKTKAKPPTPGMIAVREILERHPEGRTVKELMDETGFSDAKVRTSLNSLSNNIPIGEEEFEIVKRTQIWNYFILNWRTL